MKKNLYFFVSLVFALSAVCACSSDDDDVDTSDCNISFYNNSKK